MKKGAYDDDSFLRSAFEDQDAAIFALSVQASPGDHDRLIDAAAKAGVKWILPNEFASDGANDKMIDGCPLLQPKREARKYIETLSKTHPGLQWIAVVTNPWIENSVHPLLLGLDLTTRIAIIAPDSGYFNLSTLDRVGEGVKQLLCLPITNPDNPRASLEHYGNNFVYLSSVYTSQQEAFETIQRITKTKQQDWNVQLGSIAERIRKANAALAAGGDGAFPALIELMGAYYIGEGLGGDYQSKSLEDLKVLGLGVQDLDEVFGPVVDAGPPNTPKLEHISQHYRDRL